MYGQTKFADSLTNPGSVAQSSLQPVRLLVQTDGSTASINRAITATMSASQNSLSAQTKAEAAGGNRESEYINELANLTYIGIVFSILISDTSLVVSTIITMIDRRRIFGLLRLMGSPVSVIRRMVLFEAIVPLLATVLAAGILGFGTANIIIGALSENRHLQAPGYGYFITIGVSSLIVLIVLLLATRSVKSSTEVESTRFE